jgi:cysteine desulfurase family protein (TIGR01976 family)
MFNVAKFRQQFPALKETNAKKPPIFLDAVGGTQVPQTVIDAITDHLLTKNGNKGGVFPTSVKTDEMMEETRKIVAEFINAPDSNEIIFGPNFTTLTFSISRSLAKTWKQGDEIILSRLDHDANVSPWVLAAEDAGVVVRYMDIDDNTCQINLENYKNVLSEKTKLVAFCAASSSVGTRTDVKTIARMAHEVGALVYVDAVAYAPHDSIDVQEWEADFVGCSSYKFFGPHVGLLWGKREYLEALPAYKIRPAPNEIPGKWMNGAQAFEIVTGAKAAIEYLAFVGKENPSFRKNYPQFTGRQLDIHAGMSAIAEYESSLTWRFIDEIKKRSRYTLWGVSDEKDKMWRVPTIAISLGNEQSDKIAKYLAKNNIYIWSRSVYSISLSERLGLEKTGGFIRVGFAHYNTFEEVDTLLEKLDQYKI